MGFHDRKICNHRAKAVLAKMSFDILAFFVYLEGCFGSNIPPYTYDLMV